MRVDVDVLLRYLKRLAADLAAGFQPAQQKMKVQHSALRTSVFNNVLCIEQAPFRNECDVSRDARIIKGGIHRVGPIHAAE